MHPSAAHYRGYRFAGTIISRCVWLYYRLNLSLREVREIVAMDGVAVSHETIRQWCRTFGPRSAAALVRRRAPPADKWHCDEVHLKVNGRTHCLWRAVGRNGIELGILAREQPSKEAACAFLRRALCLIRAVPPVVVTDKLRSYRAALQEVLPGVEHRRHKGLNGRAEDSHRPTRRRERGLRRVKSPEHAQRFLEPFGQVGNHFRPRRHLLGAYQYRA
jgi:putative transposase